MHVEAVPGASSALLYAAEGGGYQAQKLRGGTRHALAVSDLTALAAFAGGFSPTRGVLAAGRATPAMSELPRRDPGGTNVYLSRLVRTIATPTSSFGGAEG